MSRCKHLPLWFVGLIMALAIMEPSPPASAADTPPLPSLRVEGEYTQRSDAVILIANSRPLSTTTSTVASIKVNAAEIPDGAVVTRVEFRSSGIVAGQPARNGPIVSLQANILGPGMADWVKKPWGKGNATEFSARDLGVEAVLVKGEWLVSYDGRNLSDRLPGFKGHRGLSLRIHYEYEKGLGKR